jgi:uncharacterized protein with FMN-binding domain
MRRNLAALLGTLTALVLLFSYHTSLDSSASTPTAATAPQTPGSDSSSSSSSGSSSSGTKTYTGEVADTRWGPVQVEITVTNDKITVAKTTQVPSDNPHDQEINSYAVPVLNQEAVQAQSAQIDAVSGATVTSDGYIQSLQSAIDQAHL